jgi:DNA-binding CsgD family transcriptional regulator
VLVGRAGELEQVDQLLGDALDGRSRLLRLVGEPGVGCTALLDAAARRAARRGLRVARRRAVADVHGTPYALVRDLLRVLEAPSLAPTGEGGETDALVSAIEAATAHAPLLLVVDDLPDADAASAQALVTAVERTSDRAVATLVAEPTVGHSSGSPAAAWPTLRLAPIGDDAARAVVRAALGTDVASSTVDGIVGRMGGVPGALIAAARSLAPEEVRGKAPLPDELPVGPPIEAAWRRVLEALPPATREALLVLATVGPDDPHLLAGTLATCGRDAADLSPAERRGLVRYARGRVELRGPVLGAVVRSGAAHGDTRRIHRRAADVGAVTGADPAVVARHLVGSTLLPDPDVADALQRQAEQSLSRGRRADAAKALDASARLTPDPALRRTRAMAAVRERVESDLDGFGSRDLLALVGPRPLPPGEQGWVRWLEILSEPDYPSALGAALASVDAMRAGPERGLLRALLWDAAGTAWAVGRADLGLRLAQEFAALDRAGVPSARDEPPWTADALVAAGLIQVGRLREGCARRRDVLARADSLQPDACPLSLLLEAAALDDLLLADTPGAEARISRAVARADACGYQPVACLWGIRAWRERARGAWHSALRWRDEGLAVSVESRMPGTVSGLLALSVELSALRGDTGRLRDDALALRRLAGELGDVRRLLTLERALGMDALVRGELVTALAHLQQAADVPFVGRGLRDAVLASRVDLVEVLLRLGDTAAAADRAAAVAPLLEEMDLPLATALAARVRAQVADYQRDAAAWFETSLAAHEAAPDPFESARTALLYGEYLRRARRRAEARRYLAQAEVGFASLDAAPWVQRAEQELRVAGGAGVPASAVAGASSGLTPQELHVVQAVTEGRSTREVAELLVLSPRTVESHLSHAYRKLGIAGRNALPAALARQEPALHGESASQGGRARAKRDRSAGGVSGGRG